MRFPTWAKAAAAGTFLLIVLIMTGGYVGQYRAAKGGSGARARTSTSSPDATGSAKPATVSGAGRGVMTSDPGADPRWVIVQIEGLNLRTKPESDADVIRGLSRDERLTYVGERTGWYQVTDKEGRTGWISSNPQYAVVER